MFNGLSGKRLHDEILCVKENLSPLLQSGRILIAQILCPENMIVGKMVDSDIIWTEINYEECEAIDG